MVANRNCVNPPREINLADAKNHLRTLMFRMPVPDLRRVSYQDAQEQYAYRLVRDVLLDFGMPMRKAERLADRNKGAPGRRLEKAVSEWNDRHD